MPRTKILRVRLNDPEWDALAALAAARGVSKSEAVRDLIKELLKEKTK
jgi:hypothetical protein